MLAVVGRRKAVAVFEGPRKVVLGLEAQPESDFLCGKRLEFQSLFRFFEYKRLLEIQWANPIGHLKMGSNSRMALLAAMQCTCK